MYEFPSSREGNAVSAERKNTKLRRRNHLHFCGGLINQGKNSKGISFAVFEPPPSLATPIKIKYKQENKMEIIDGQSDNQHPFAKGIQGAPDVGFNLASDGNYDMAKKKLTNLADGTNLSDAVPKSY